MVSAFPALAASAGASSSDAKPVILTATPLLASVVAQQLAEQRLADGFSGWERSDVLTVEAWLSSCWQEARFAGADVPSLLSTSQESLLWQSVIDSETPGLFDAAATARLARQALHTIAEWRIPLDDIAWGEHQDGRQFLNWLNKFRAHCQDRSWMSRADLWDMVPQWIETRLCSRRSLLLVATRAVSPGLQRIVDALPDVTWLERGQFKTKRVTAIQFSDWSAELEAAACWARTCVESSPEKTVGVFVPNLASHRSHVERIFTQVFYPPSILRLSAPPADCVFHLSAAMPLIEHPLISSALLVLELIHARIDQASASALLRNPFITGAQTERELRALADAQLRRDRQLDLNLRQIVRAVGASPTLFQALSKVQKLVGAIPARQALSDWGELFVGLLAAAGWPGDATLSTQEQEVLESWKNSLSMLSTLGLVASQLTGSQALWQLRSILGRAAGPARGDWFSPIQILDAQEAEGLRFDSAFVTGLADATWPPAIQISTLIPIRPQREAGIPGASSASAQSERRRLTQALMQSGSSIQASYSDQISPLAASFVSLKTASKQKSRLPLHSFKQSVVNPIEDAAAPPFTRHNELRGGTSVIKSQSLCPFKAFAEIRLKARTQEDGCFGFDARERGGFLHTALQLVWRELGTQSRLRKTSEQELRQLIATAVEQSLTIRQDGESYLQIQATERTRLEQLIYDWLQTIDANRLMSFSVEDVETAVTFNVAGLPLNLRIDRIDRLANGKLVLIDYKSGSMTRNKICGPRPDEPQLLVYAAAKGREVDGIFFGQVRARDLKFPGQSRDRHLPRGIAQGAKWDDFLEESRAEVERLAAEFLAGVAAVDPKKNACNFCTTNPLCRVSEHTAATEDEA